MSSVPESFKKKQARNEALAKASAAAAATAAKVINDIVVVLLVVTKVKLEMSLSCRMRLSTRRTSLPRLRSTLPSTSR